MLIKNILISLPFFVVHFACHGAFYSQEKRPFIFTNQREYPSPPCSVFTREYFHPYKEGSNAVVFVK
ncbi:MAG TPA: hypothetical protein VJ201_07370, partial [Candidatus Babeliales bacterium]|nr:hypothetical protein [Candidatus Babeliales bacterium]